MDQYRFVYLVMVGVAFLIWLAIFLVRKDLRKEMLVMSGLISVLGVTQLLFAGTYWSPTYVFSVHQLSLGAEDFLVCAFFYGGIGSVLYQFISSKKYVCHPMTRTGSVLPICIVPFTVGLATFLLLSIGTHANIIYTSTFGLLATALTLVSLRPGYAKAVFANGVLLGILDIAILAVLNAVFPGFIEHTWTVSALSGGTIFSVPIEEFYFNFAAGACFAVAYECLFNCKPVV